eukprot:Skav234826  [mRNA]  locus=scaffold69:1003612:1004271:- [translate_table: standard]
MQHHEAFQASRLRLLEPLLLVFASMRLFCILVACLHVLSLASNDANQVGNETTRETVLGCSERYYIRVKNSCHKTVQVGIRYKQIGGRWKTRCWYTISPDVNTYLALAGGDRIVTENRLWAYYAEALEGNEVWPGNTTAYCSNRRVQMRTRGKVDSYGDLSIDLTCSNGFVQDTDVAGLMESGPNIPNISSPDVEASPREQVEQIAPGVDSAPTPELLP